MIAARLRKLRPHTGLVLAMTVLALALAACGGTATMQLGPAA